MNSPRHTTTLRKQKFYFPSQQIQPTPKAIPSLPKIIRMKKQDNQFSSVDTVKNGVDQKKSYIFPQQNPSRLNNNIQRKRFKESINLPQLKTSKNIISHSTMIHNNDNNLKNSALRKCSPLNLNTLRKFSPPNLNNNPYNNQVNSRYQLNLNGETYNLDTMNNKYLDTFKRHSPRNNPLTITDRYKLYQIQAELNKLKNISPVSCVAKDTITTYKQFLDQKFEIEQKMIKQKEENRDKTKRSLRSNTDQYHTISTQNTCNNYKADLIMQMVEDSNLEQWDQSEQSFQVGFQLQ